MNDALFEPLGIIADGFQIGSYDLMKLVDAFYKAEDPLSVTYNTDEHTWILRGMIDEDVIFSHQIDDTAFYTYASLDKRVSSIVSFRAINIRADAAMLERRQIATAMHVLYKSS